jgi:hypothetical protein
MSEEEYDENEEFVICCCSCRNNVDKNAQCPDCIGVDKNECFKCLKRVDRTYQHPKYPNLRRQSSLSYCCWRPKNEKILPMVSDVLLTNKDFEI